eukprot:GHVU01054886.1.p1 GENE.GHVU01054886.1~~GHVU01054886.1.p1  ORF type:complete len:489 (-),score=69.14 GHVU01054886.1:60-1526(-)
MLNRLKQAAKRGLALQYAAIAQALWDEIPGMGEWSQWKKFLQAPLNKKEYNAYCELSDHVRVWTIAASLNAEAGTDAPLPLWNERGAIADQENLLRHTLDQHGEIPGMVWENDWKELSGQPAGPIPITEEERQKMERRRKKEEEKKRLHDQLAALEDSGSEEGEMREESGQTPVRSSSNAKAKARSDRGSQVSLHSEYSGRGMFGSGIPAWQGSYNPAGAYHPTEALGYHQPFQFQYQPGSQPPVYGQPQGQLGEGQRPVHQVVPQASWQYLPDTQGPGQLRAQRVQEAEIVKSPEILTTFPMSSSSRNPPNPEDTWERSENQSQPLENQAQSGQQSAPISAEFVTAEIPEEAKPPVVRPSCVDRIIKLLNGPPKREVPQNQQVRVTKRMEADCVEFDTEDPRFVDKDLLNDYGTPPIKTFNESHIKPRNFDLDQQWDLPEFGFEREGDKDRFIQAQLDICRLYWYQNFWITQEFVKWFWTIRVCGGG